MKVKIQTLTPLWTGGVDGRMDRIHETGIIGSMRWWYEAIVRGLGGSACDPSRHECPDREARYCDSCALFGTTGIKRSFRIDWPALQNMNKNEQLIINVNNNRGWYLKRGLFERELDGRFLSTRQLNWTEWDKTSHILALVIKLASEWGGLGARTQQGYGVVKVTTDPDVNIEKALQFIEKVKQRSNRKANPEQELPKMGEFFFGKVRFYSGDPWAFVKANAQIDQDQEYLWYKNNEVIPLSSLVRYYLRKLIRNEIVYDSKEPNSAARWQLMGVIEARYHSSDLGKITDIEWRCDKCGKSWNRKPRGHKCPRCSRRVRSSKWQCENCKYIWSLYNQVERDTNTAERYKSLINASNAYSVGEDLYEFRIWGWLPQELPGNLSQKYIMKKLSDWVGVGEDCRKWQDASLGALWGPNCVNLSQPQILWYARRNSETPEAFLKALITPGESL